MTTRARPAPRPAGGWGERLVGWLGRRRASPLWTLAVAIVVLVVLLPVASILVLALGPSDGLWAHLAGTILPRAVGRTVGLMAGVGIGTLLVGTATAWLVAVYRFPGRDLVAWMLMLPLAVPTYIVAYCYGDLLDYTGPVQTGLRALMGWHSARDYWFPDVRSLGGAIAVLSLVLYPYVYLTARASFLQQSVGTLEVARTLGRSARGTFWSVALPLARPALVAGVSLVLMECLNDVGAAEYLGVRTLTVTAYDTWLQRSSLAGTAQIAAVMLVFVLLLFSLERISRGERGFHDPAARLRPPPEVELGGLAGWLALALCLLPCLLGFALPVGLLARTALANLVQVGEPSFWQAAASSLTVSTLSALLAALLALVLAYARRVAPNGFTRPAVRVAGLGYALPGTVLAVGLMVPLAGFDNALDGFLRTHLGVSTGLLLSGSLVAVVLAYTIRFLAVSLGAIEAGLTRISPNLDAAARTLGQTSLGALRRVHLPLLRPPVGAALLLVFVDAMKELPATLLLRPFNFETLALRVYSLASLDRFEEAALAALMIVAAGLVPLILLSRAVRRGYADGPAARPAGLADDGMTSMLPSG